MDEKEKKLREDLEFHLDTLRRNLEVVSVKVSTGSAQIKGRTEPALPTSKFSGQSGRMAKTVRRNQGRLGLAL